MPEFIDIQTLGFEKTGQLLRQGASEPLAKAVAKTANYLETTAKKTIRDVVYKSKKSEWYKRTGKASQSIVASKLDPLAWRVFVGVNYGKYLEEGTGIYHTPGARKPFWTTFGGRLKQPIKYKGMKARPFWLPSIKATQAKAPEFLKQEVDKFFK